MKKSILVAVLAAVLSLGVSCLHAFAQAQAQAYPGMAQPTAQPTALAPGQPARIALLDVVYVFKNHARLKAMRVQLKEDAMRVKQDINARQKQIMQMSEELRQLDKASDMYKEREEKITELQARLQVEMKKAELGFMQREAREMHMVYQEVRQATEYLCQKYGYDLVLMSSRTEFNQDNPDSVYAEMSRPVVWHRGIDITDQVLVELNRGVAAPNPNADLRNDPRPANPYPR
ncbi:MAG: OmpH family outer membrane protein [Thermoguttaceae bacterium]